MSRSVPARCGSGRCVGLFKLRGELGGRQIAEAGVRPNLVVMPAPSLNDDLGLNARGEPFQTQALVAELAVEALADAVLPRLSQIDQSGLDALVDDPTSVAPGRRTPAHCPNANRAAPRAR